MFIITEIKFSLGLNIDTGFVRAPPYRSHTPGCYFGIPIRGGILRIRFPIGALRKVAGVCDSGRKGPRVNMKEARVVKIRTAQTEHSKKERTPFEPHKRKEKRKELVEYLQKDLAKFQTFLFCFFRQFVARVLNHLVEKRNKQMVDVRLGYCESGNVLPDIMLDDVVGDLLDVRYIVS